MSHFVLADRKTDYLLPPSVDDWLTQDHLARFVVEVIDQLDLSNLTRKYAGRGSKAYHPATLLAIIVYGYATGVFSSRRLETACLLYTSDAADDLLCVDLGGRRIIKKK